MMRLGPKLCPAMMLVAAAGGVACGDLSTASGPEDALFVVTARLEGNDVPAAVGTYRAEAQWLSFGAGEALECFLNDAPERCLAQELETRQTRASLALTPALQGFQLALFALPSQSELLDHEGARLAVAGFTVFDDRDETDGLSPGDTVVASSVFGAQISLLVFREGPLHPFFRLLEVVHGCPPPPLGYSVLRADVGFGCRVSRITTAIATVRSEESYTFAACGGNVVRLIDPPPERATVRQAGEAALCLGDNRARIFADRGEVCDPYRARRLESLVDCQPGFLLPTCWDDRDEPPTGWPCPIERGDE